MFSLLWTLLACQEQPPTPSAPPTGTDSADTASPTTAPLDWAPCTAESGATGAAYRCAEVAVPLDWADPDGEQLTLFVKKRLAARPSGRGVWMLSGGPGFSGRALEPAADFLAAADDSLDLYMLDHRGTGWSAPLTCTGHAEDSLGGVALTPDEIPGCQQELLDTLGAARLAHYSSTQAALDLGHLIEMVGDPQVFVQGASYGTWWGHRYLQLWPEQADGVVLDSMCAPGACFISQQDIWEDPVLEAWLTDTCLPDAACTDHLPDPWGALQQLHADLEGDHCPVLGWTGAEKRANLRVALSYLFAYADLRPAVPILIHRAARCSADDEAAITSLYGLLFGGGAAPSAAERSLYNDLLAIHVSASELWEQPAPAQETLDQRYADSLVGRGVSQFVGAMSAGWPTYTEPLADQFAVTDTPMLMLHARYDNFTPLEAAALPMQAAFTGPDQHFVVIDNAGHTVYTQSRMGSDPYRFCGLEIMVAFMQDPHAPLPLDCLDDLYPVVFTPSSAWSNQVFGTPDAWGSDKARRSRADIDQPVAPLGGLELLRQPQHPQQVDGRVEALERALR